MATQYRRDLVALLAYLLLTLVLTYPLVLHFGTHVTGDGGDDPALAWNLWWVRYALFDLGANPIFTDFMFFPIGLNLAFYTLTYLNAFLSIPFQFTLGLVPAVNLNLVLSFTLSGFGAYLLVKYLLRHTEALAMQADEAAFIAGLVYAFSSNKFLYASLGQFNIASSHWIPFYILFLIKAFPFTSTAPGLGVGALGGSARYGFLLGLFLLLQALSELIFASFLVIVTVVYLLFWILDFRFSIRVSRNEKRGTRTNDQQSKIQNPNSRIEKLQSLILTVFFFSLTFLLPMSPILAAMLADIQAEGDFIQSGLGFSNIFSADLLGFFVPSRLHPLFGGLEAQFHFAYINFVYLGYIALALALIATLKVKPARVWALAFAAVLVVTLGPTLRVNGAEIDLPLPFEVLLALPLIKGNRYPSRWSVLLTLCLAVMVGYGVAWLLNRARQMADGESQIANRKSPVSNSGSAISLVSFANQKQSPISNLQSRRSRLAALCLLPPASWLLPTLLSFLLLFEHVSLPLSLSDFRIPDSYAPIAREPGSWSVMELPLAWRNGFRVTGSYRADSQAPIDRIFMFAQWYQTAQQHPILNGNTSRNPELKFQYFAEAPVLDSLIAVQTGHAVDDATRSRDRALAPQVLHFLGTRYVIWHTPYETVNRDVADKTRAYLESVLPVTQISESYANERGVVAYRVKPGPATEEVTINPTHPLARLYLGEGWGALGGDALWMQRNEATIFLPLDAPRATRLTLQGVRRSGSDLTLRVNGHTIARTASASAENYDFSIPAGVLHAGMNVLTLEAGTLTRVAEANLPLSIVARSAGEEQGAFGHIYVNGEDESPNERGYNIVVLEPHTGQVLARGNFDTFNSEGESQRLAEFIDRVAPGEIVAVAASDEASFHLTPSAVDALRSIGGQQDLRGKFRWSHALIGVKAAPSASASEAASETRVSQVMLNAPLTEPTIAARVSAIRIEIER